MEERTYGDSLSMSLPRERMVRGYAIRRMPIGQYLRAAQTLRDWPEDVLPRLLPGLHPGNLLNRLRRLTAEEMQTLFQRALAILPGYAVSLFAALSGIEERALLEDEAIGLDGLMEMLEAWLHVNGIENFIKAAGALQDKVRSFKTGTGSKG
ncbi:MAG: hypothetical protein E7319_05315 [Clostridiales bacterium]|nr:hypothetical protein [Clostridiales bacterium]